MAIPKIVGSQRDFSMGEVDVSLKRADESPVMKTGCRQLVNFRILTSGAVKNRPGRSAVLRETGRVEPITMPGSQSFSIAFTAADHIRIYNNVGTQVFDAVASPAWPSLGSVSYAIIGLTIYIAYPGVQPLALSWDGVSQTSTWSIAFWSEAIGAGGQKRTLFYRISPQNITMQPSNLSGVVNIVFSAPVLSSGMVGTRMRYCGRQIVIKTVTDSQHGTATVIESLPPAVALTLTSTAGQFNIGDEVIGATSGATGIVTTSPSAQVIFFSTPASAGAFVIGDTVTGSLSGATGVVNFVIIPPGPTGAISEIGVLLSGTFFQVGDTVSGPHGSGTATSVGSNPLTIQLVPKSNGLIATYSGSEVVAGPSGSGVVNTESVGTPQPVTIWDDEVMNSFRGYPSFVFADQTRLGFANFPAVPKGIAWSAIGNYTDLYVGAIGDNAIFELVPTTSMVLYVVPGMESAEFVFCDNAIFYIPITPTNPLEPGSVAFNELSGFGALANVQPRRAEQSIIFMKAGGVEVGALQTPGAYFRPHIVDVISEMHSHLFTASTAVAIAVPSAQTQFEERYIYIVLANGNLVVGKYQMRQGLIEPGADGRPKIGWAPWNGNGTSSWVAATGAAVLFTTSYAPNGVPAVSIVEQQDNTQLLDGALSVNNLPATFTPPGGKGPLYNFPGPNGTVFLFDLGGRPMGVYNIDANGFIIAQNIDGENLSSSQLVAGQAWTATIEPFTPLMQPGQDLGQRMKKRRAARHGVYVSQSTGFLLARLFSGPLTPTSPALGTIMNFFRVTAYNQGDDPTKSAPLREEAKFWRPLGRAYDPRYAVIKDTPGSLMVHEIGWEATI